LGEVCEKFAIPTVTSTITSTPANLLEERNGLAVGTAVGGFISLFLIGGICLSRFGKCQTGWKRALKI
jgi:hypothetical protein